MYLSCSIQVCDNMVALNENKHFNKELHHVYPVFNLVLAKGRSHSSCYRFMTRSGDWVWVRSKSCVTYDAISHLPNGLSIYTWIVR